MPETVAGYELFQLPCSRESTESVTFAEFRNKLGEDGYRSQVLYGADTGQRKFSIPHDTLAGGGNAATITVGGVPMNQATYIRDLFRRVKRSGQPFVIQSLENSQYYLVEFEESEQTLSKKLAARYATTVNLVQVRIPGVVVFDPAKLPLWGRYRSNAFDYMGTAVADDTGNSHPLVINGNITNTGTVQNGVTMARFNSGATNTGFLSSSHNVTVYDALFIMKVNELTFSNNCGILTSATGTAAPLLGSSGTTKFQDLALGTAYEYRKNGILYANDNQQAPIGEVALVHCRWKSGIALTSLQIGKDRATAGTFAEIDFGEAQLFDAPSPLSDMFEAAEAIQEDWNI